MSRTPYKFGRHGGHVGSHLRDPFCEYVETGEFLCPEDVRHHGRVLGIRELTGLLWNCTDYMPGDACDELELVHGSSYARGARAVRAALST